jgi:DNA-binding transcriptional regulator YiaG
MDKIEIKNIRKKLGMSQQNFATMLGVGITTVNRWENGVFEPTHLAEEKLQALKDKMRGENGY